MSKKDTKGKPKLSLIPYEALAQIAHIREFGVEKYGDDEAWYDVPVKDFLDAALRHIYKHLSGELDDSESGRSHIAHAATSLILALAIDQEDRYFDRYVQERLDPRRLDHLSEQERINYIMSVFDTDLVVDKPIDLEEVEHWLNIEDYISEREKNKLTSGLNSETLDIGKEIKCTCPTHLFNGA